MRCGARELLLETNHCINDTGLTRSALCKGDTINSFQKRAAIRIAVASILLASIASPASWFVASERAEKSIVALAIEESLLPPLATAKRKTRSCINTFHLQKNVVSAIVP